MKALVVDDEPAILDVIINNIDWDKLGVEETYRASNVPQAKGIIETNRPEIIISDIEMPQHTGLDLLEWYREKDYDGEFLFLTSHERFDYASHAIHLGASEYLLKPFDVAVMEGALKKLIQKVKEKKSSVEIKNKMLQKQLMVLLFEDHTQHEVNILKNDIDGAFLDSGEYVIIVSKLSSVASDKDRIHTSLLKFMLENIHNEVLTGNPDGIMSHCFDMHGYCHVVTVCEQNQDYKQKCNILLREINKLFTGTFTCLICNPAPPEEFFDTYQRAVHIIDSYIAGIGSVYYEAEYEATSNNSVSLFDEGKINGFLNNREKIGLMVYLRETLNNLIQAKTLSQHEISLMNQQIMQGVYSYLAARNVSAIELYADDELKDLTLKAAQSVTDMVKWVNYFVDRAFLCVDSVKEGQSFVEKINQYIYDHYTEDIGRNEIAAEFYLNPEYLSKIYKKQTGVSLKDYINEYRINQAKILLEDDSLKISEVASLVGFENFTYFSTTFKKYTGLTPNQYRKETQ